MGWLAAIASWFGRLPPSVVDAALAGAAVATMVSARLTTTPSLGARLPAAVALATVIGGSLAFRRRLPVTSYAVGTSALAVEALWLTPLELSTTANLIGLFSVGYFATVRRAPWGPVIMLPGIAAYFAGEKSPVPTAVPAGVVFGWLVVWALGYAAARRRERQDSEQRLMRRDAVLDERHRVARELHDLIGHTVNVMLVRTGAARVVLDSDPDKAREILAGVEQTGRGARRAGSRAGRAARQRRHRPAAGPGRAASAGGADG